MPKFECVPVQQYYNAASRSENVWETDEIEEMLQQELDDSTWWEEWHSEEARTW